MKHLVFYIVAFAVIFSSCAEKTHYRGDSEALMEVVEPLFINGSALHYVGQALGSRQLIPAGDYIITTSNNPAAMFNIFDIHSKELLASFGNKGRGPNDFILPFSIKQYWKDSLDNTFIVVTDNQDICTINVTESVKEGYPVKEIIGKLDSFGEYSAVFNNVAILGPDESFKWIGPKYIDARDGLETPPYFLLQLSDSSFDFNVFPSLFKSPAFNQIHYFSYEGAIRISSDKKKAAFFPCMINEFVIFDIPDKKTKRVIGQSPIPFEDLGKKAYDDIINSGKLFSIDASVSDQMIAVLLDGRRIIETREGAGKQSSIQLFDWEGHTLAELHFDKYYTQVALNENNQELYLLDTEDNICRLDLQPYITTSSD